MSINLIPRYYVRNLKNILDFKPWEDEFKENKKAISKEKRGE